MNTAAKQRLRGAFYPAEHKLLRLGTAIRRVRITRGPRLQERRRSDDDQVLRGRRQDVGTIAADDHQVLDPYAEAAGQVHAGLHRDRVSRRQRALPARGQPRLLVDLQADAVAEPVSELLAVTGRLDDPAGD